MKRFPQLLLMLLATSGAAVTGHAQSPAKTVEGYWQDTERRILFSRQAPPGYAYGRWTQLEQDQTYPSAKEIRRGAGAIEVVDLNYDDVDYRVTTVAGTPEKIVFVREVKWTGCAMHHQCSLEGEGMFCSLENVCPEGGKLVLDWKGEERYARRASCERDGRVQAQGFPVKCR